jgi:hypothetical protein
MRPVAPSRAVHSLAALSLLLLQGACAARVGVPGPMVADRPDFTESAETVPAGMVQVEGGVTVGESILTRTVSYGELLLRAGVAPWAEVRVGLPSHVVRRAGARPGSSWTETSLGAKLRLLTPAAGAARLKPTMALIVDAAFPTNGEGAGLGAKLAAAWALSGRVGLGVNGGFARPFEGDAHDGMPSLGASLGLDASERLGLFVEAYSTGDSYVDGGLTWRLGPALQLDARVGASVGDMLDARFVGVGFARRF